MFCPIPAEGKKLAATATSGGVTLVAAGDALMYVNIGAKVVFVKKGVAAPTAEADKDLPVLPGAQVVISRRPDELYVAGVCSAGETTTLYIVPGYVDTCVG